MSDIMKATESIQKSNDIFSDGKESTELSLFVRTSDEELKKWDRAKIYDALMRETTISEDAASIVAREVEKMISELEIDVITAPLIRELTNAKLVEYGLSKIRKQHTRLGVPLYDARQIIMMPNKENANVPHGPEATNLTLAENIKKEFALLEVFSQDLADAHRNAPERVVPSRRASPITPATVYASRTERTAFSGIPNQSLVLPLSRSKSAEESGPSARMRSSTRSATAAFSASAAAWNCGPLRPAFTRYQGNSLAGTNDSALLVVSKISRRS
jgi:hypothetical protein